MDLIDKLKAVEKYNILSDKLEIVFVGDTHFNYISPRSRIDDYPTVCLNKLDTLRKLCKARNISHVVFLGDLFHKPKQPVDYLLRVLQALKKFQQDNIACYVVAGNHDLTYQRLDSLDKSALGLMIEAEVIKPFSLLRFNLSGQASLNIYGAHYSEEFHPLMELDTSHNPIGDYNILVAHAFYNFDLDSSSLHEKDLVNLGYDMYVLGHDHTPYDLETAGGKSLVVRPGAFMRGTSHKYNLSREVYVDIVKYENKKVAVDRCTIETQPAELVFSSLVTDKADIKTLSNDLKSQFNFLITMLEAPSSNNNFVYLILDKMQIQPKVKARIEQYLTDFGVFRLKEAEE